MGLSRNQKIVKLRTELTDLRKNNKNILSEYHIAKLNAKDLIHLLHNYIYNFPDNTSNLITLGDIMSKLNCSSSVASYLIYTRKHFNKELEISMKQKYKNMYNFYISNKKRIKEIEIKLTNLGKSK